MDEWPEKHTKNIEQNEIAAFHRFFLHQIEIQDTPEEPIKKKKSRNK